MHVYELGYYSPEGSFYHQLVHTSEFSRDQFIALVCEAARRVLLTLLEEGKHEREIDSLRFEGLLEFVGNVLIYDFGFKPLEFSGQLHFYRWAELFDEEDRCGERKNTGSDFLILENTLKAELSSDQIGRLRGLFRMDE